MNTTSITSVNEVLVNVWAHRNDEFTAKMAKINARIQKKGIMAVLDWDLVKTVMVDISKNPAVKKLAQMFVYKLRYPKIALPGDWELVGEITEGSVVNGKTFNFVNGYGDLSKYTSVDLCHCDHCHVRRHRVHSMILKSKVDGSEVVVGSTCLRDFLGHDPEAAVYMLQFLESFESFGRADDENSKNYFASLDTVIKCIIFTLKQDGWRFLSRKKASVDGGAATADCVWEVYSDLSTTGNPLFPQTRIYFHTDFFKETSAELLKQIQELADHIGETEMSDFDLKIAIIGKREALDLATKFQLSIFTAWAAKKILDIVNPVRETRVPSEHFSSVGEKVTITVIPERVHTHDGDYGTVHIISGIVSGTANKWTWFGTGAAVRKMVSENGTVVADEFVITATVKRHTDDKYGKHTVLTRVKVI